MRAVFSTVLIGMVLLVAACGQQQQQQPAAGEGDTAAKTEETPATGTTSEATTDTPSMAEEAATEAMEEEDCASPNVLCVGLVTDVGQIDDKSFNQAAWEGVLLAQEEHGAVTNYVETTDPNDYADNIALFAEEGYDVIVTVGFALGQATIEAAAQYPDINFIGVDQFQVEPLPNIAGLVFDEEKAGYLAGALAAQMSESNTIAAVLGTDLVPPVVAFKEGYEAGAQFINPDITIISTYHPGGLDVAFTDPEWGATTAKQAIDQGADVVFGAGGKTGNGALIETANAEDAYCIGVDSDQWQTLPEAHGCLISSAMKLITPGVFDLIEMEAEGNFPSGNYMGEIGLAPFYDFEAEVPDEVKDTLAEIEAGFAEEADTDTEAETDTDAETETDESMEDETSSDTEEDADTDEAAETDSEERSIEAATSDDNCIAPETLCIGLVTDVGQVDDKSFNQSAWDGVLQAQEEFGAFVNYVETTDANDYADNIMLFTEKGYDVIVTVGFALQPATLEAAAEYPEIDFIGVDQFQTEVQPNIAGLIFAEDKAGFLAGALAAQLSESDTIAAVLGTDLVPPVVAFKEGYEAGAAFINPDITLISTYHPGGLDVAFTDPEWGATTARQAIDQGADVVFGAGGKTGNGALVETASAEGSYCIGVDTDQWLTLPEAHACLVSSAMKEITPGVFDIIQQHVDGSFPAGNYIGTVGLAPFHDFEDEVSQEVKDTLQEIEAGLEDGSIETGYNPEG
jgi:basic membrane protein A